MYLFYTRTSPILLIGMPVKHIIPWKNLLSSPIQHFEQLPILGPLATFLGIVRELENKRTCTYALKTGFLQCTGAYFLR